METSEMERRLQWKKAFHEVPVAEMDGDAECFL